MYNRIAKLLDEAGEYDGEPRKRLLLPVIDKVADGSYGPVILRLAWHSSGTYDKETNSGGRSVKPVETSTAVNLAD